MDSSQIDLILTDALEKLKKEYPTMDFFMFLQPFDKSMFAHLSAEEKREMQNNAISSATQVFSTYLKKD
jgi:hypothetical protein